MAGRIIPRRGRTDNARRANLAHTGPLSLVEVNGIVQPLQDETSMAFSPIESLAEILHALPVACEAPLCQSSYIGAVMHSAGVSSRVEDAALMVSDVAGRLDFLYEALGVQVGAVESFTPGGLEGMARIIGDAGDILREAGKKLDAVTTAAVADSADLKKYFATDEGMADVLARLKSRAGVEDGLVEGDTDMHAVVADGPREDVSTAVEAPAVIGGVGQAEGVEPLRN